MDWMKNEHHSRIYFLRIPKIFKVRLTNSIKNHFRTIFYEVNTKNGLQYSVKKTHQEHQQWGQSLCLEFGCDLRTVFASSSEFNWSLLAMQCFSKPTIAVERLVPGAVECPLPARTGLRDIAAKENRLKTKKFCQSPTQPQLELGVKKEWVGQPTHHPTTTPVKLLRHFQAT